MPEPRAFTNIPGGEGEYVPARPGWIGPAQVQPQAEEESTIFPKPPTIGEGYMTPNYSNRSLFERHVFQEIGGNPFGLNPRDALQFADENLPDLFERFFRGTIVWEDRGKLTKDQGNQWDEVVKSYHAWTLKQAEMKKAVMTDRYNFMMNQFDNAAREYQTALSKVRARREKIATRKRAQEKTPVSEKVSPIDVKRYSDMLRNIEKDMAKGTIRQAQVDALNMVARTTGAPEMVIEETELDPGLLQRGYDWITRAETQIKEVELKKKPPGKPIETKKRPVPKAKKSSLAKKKRKLNVENKTDTALVRKALKKFGGDKQKTREYLISRGYEL